MSIFKKYILVFVVCLSVTAAANASVVTETIDFTATDYTSNLNVASPPYDTASGSFTLTFNPAVATSATSTGITLNSLSIPLNFSPIGYSTDGLGDLNVGTIYNGLVGNSLAANTFTVQISGIGTADPVYANSTYTKLGIGDSFRARTGTVSVSAVPLPAGLPMFGSAVACLGMLAALIRRKRVSAIA